MPLFPNSTGRKMSDLTVITAAVAGTETTTAAVAAVVTVFRGGAGGTAGGEDGAPSAVRTSGPGRSRREAQTRSSDPELRPELGPGAQTPTRASGRETSATRRLRNTQ